MLVLVFFGSLEIFSLTAFGCWVALQNSFSSYTKAFFPTGAMVCPPGLVWLSCTNIRDRNQAFDLDAKMAQSSLGPNMNEAFDAHAAGDSGLNVCDPGEGRLQGQYV